MSYYELLPRAKKSKIRQMQHDVITPHSPTICDFGPDTVCVRARVASNYAWCGAQALGRLIYAPYSRPRATSCHGDYTSTVHVGATRDARRGRDLQSSELLERPSAWYAARNVMRVIMPLP